MDSPPRPPAYEAPSSVLSSEATEVTALMTAAFPPPEYSACSCQSNSGRPCMLEYIPSGSGTSHRVIPDPLDGSGSVVSSAHQSIAITLGASTRSTCATHPLSTCDVEPGCDPLDFRDSSVLDSPPPAYAIAMITFLPPPEYSACSYHSNCERSCLEYIPSGSGTIRSVIPDPVDGRESVLSNADQSIAIMPGSSTRSCATHPRSTCEVEPGCEPHRGFSVSDSPPRPLMITSRDVTSRPDHVVSTAPSTSSASPSNNHLLVSDVHRSIANRNSQPSSPNSYVEIFYSIIVLFLILISLLKSILEYLI